MDGDEQTAHGGDAQERMEFDAGDILWRKGDDSDYLYLIVSGKVGLFHVDDTGAETFVTNFGPNQLIGEAALYESEPRSTDVKAMENVVAMALHGEEIRQRIAGFDAISKIVIQNLLAKMKLMAETLGHQQDAHADLPEMNDILAAASDIAPDKDGELTKPRDALTRKPYAAGETLWRKGDPSNHVCVIISGTVAAYGVDENGTETLIANFGRNEMLGDNALYDSEPRSTNVRAVDDVLVMETGGKELRARIAGHDTASAIIIQNLLVKMKFMAAMLDHPQNQPAATPEQAGAGVTASSGGGGRRGGALALGGSQVIGGRQAVGGEHSGYVEMRSGESSRSPDFAWDDDLDNFDDFDADPHERGGRKKKLGGVAKVLLGMLMALLVVLAVVSVGIILWGGAAWLGMGPTGGSKQVILLPSERFIGKPARLPVVEVMAIRDQPSLKGQVVERLGVGQKTDIRGKAVINGVTWYRVVLYDGRYGFVPSETFVKSKSMTVVKPMDILDNPPPDGRPVGRLDAGKIIDVKEKIEAEGAAWYRLGLPDGGFGFVAEPAFVR